MEKHIDAMVVQCSEIAGLPDKASSIFQKGSIDAWNASPMCKLSVQMYHSSSPFFHTRDIKAANAKVGSSQFNLRNQLLQTTLCSNSAKMIPGFLYANSPVFSTVAFRDVSLLKKGSPGSGPFLCGNDNLGVSAFQAQQNEFDVQLVEPCQRTFIMFDDSGSKRRKIFHPEMMSEVLALLPPRLQVAAIGNLESLTRKGGSGRDVNLAKSLFSACLTPCGMSPTYYESNRVHIYVAMNFLSSASRICDFPPSDVNVVETKINHPDRRPELSCFSHENTEDLEALLSSDEDEVSSTGHCPSALTRNKSASPISEGYSMCKSKRRKREYEEHADDDTCSSATSGVKTVSKLITSQKVGCAVSNSDIVKDRLIFQEAALLRSWRNDLTAMDMFIPDEMSSSSSANNQKWPKRLAICQQQQQQQQQPLAEQSRKEKIKSILHLLRGIIPGAESMDTPFVLDEAIQYVKTLQSEVQKLQARKLLETPKHQ